MKLLRRLCAFSYIAGIGAAVVSHADAAVTPGFSMIHGTACVPIDNDNADGISYSQYGVVGAGRVRCNLGSGPGRASAPHRVIVTVRDNNPLDWVQCSMFQVYGDGNTAFTQFLDTFGQSGNVSLVFDTSLTDYYTFLDCFLPSNTSVVTAESF